MEPVLALCFCSYSSSNYRTAVDTINQLELKVDREMKMKFAVIDVLVALLIAQRLREMEAERIHMFQNTTLHFMMIQHKVLSQAAEATKKHFESHPTIDCSNDMFASHSAQHDTR